MDKVFHHLGAVIDAFEQDTLVPERNPAIGKAPQSITHFARELTRVVNMHTHPQRMILAQHGAELRRDALWKENRNPGSDSEELEMRDGTQALKNRLQARVREQKGVAAG